MKKRIKCMNSIDKLFLLDAYALIYRAYYAFIKNPANQFKRIQHFSHSRALSIPWKKCSRRESHTHRSSSRPVGPTFRHEAYEQYKAQREETPEASAFRTYYKGHHPRLPHPHPRSIRLRSRRRDRHARHRSRTARASPPI